MTRVEFPRTVERTLGHPKLTISLGLSTVFALALGLRLLAGVDYPFHPDAAYMALKAEQIYTLGRMFELRQILTYPPAWPYLLAYAGKLTSFMADRFAVNISGIHFSEIYLPPLMGATLALSTALLGRAFYDWKTGVFAAFGVALSPLAIALSARGASDHDALSSTLIVLTITAFMVCLRVPRSREREQRKGTIRTASLWVIPGAIFTLSLLAWKGSIVLTMFAAIMVFSYLVTKDRAMDNHRWTEGDGNTMRAKLTRILPYTALLFLIPTFVDAVFDFSHGYNVVLSAGDIFGSIAHYVIAFLAGAHMLPPGSLSLLFPTVGEYQPLSFTNVFFLLGLFNILAPLAIFSFLDRPSQRDIAALTFLVIMFGAAFRSTDLTYMAVPFVSLASARFLTWAHAKAAHGPKAPALLVSGIHAGRTDRLRNRNLFFVFIVLASLGPAAFGLVYAVQFVQTPQNVPAMPSYWFDVFSWMRTHTCNNSLIFGWWDYGYWISYWGKRLPVVDNGYQPNARIIDVAKTIIGSDAVLARQIMANYSAEDGTGDVYYIITSSELTIMPVIRYAATFNLTTSTAQTSPSSPVPQSVLSNSIYFRLFYSNASIGQQPIPGFTLAFKNVFVQVYKVQLPLQPATSGCI